MVAIEQIISNGILFDPKNWNTIMSQSQNFPRLIDDFFNLLTSRKITYLLVGGVALLSYVEGRNTQDIDIILDRSDLASLPEIKIIDESQDFIRGKFGDLIIDGLLTQNHFFDYVNHHYFSRQTFGERTVRCVSVEGLIALKLYALPSLYRQGNFEKVSIYENDILLLLLNYSVNFEPFLKLLSQHLLSSNVLVIKEIMKEIEMRIERFSTHKKKLADD